MIKPLVSIVIVNWNGAAVLPACLQSLKKISFSRWELILVDNGSEDGSEKLVSKYKLSATNYKLIKNSANLGFAKANNQALPFCRGKYILLLNNDTKVKKDFLDVLVKIMEQDLTIGVVQPKIYIMDNPRYLDNAGSYLTMTGFLQHWGYMEKDSSEFNSQKEIFSAKGACMLIRKKIVDKIGLFDNDFGTYFEESDFCFRVWLFGFKVVYYPQTYIYHKVGFSSKKQNQIFVNYNSNKNRICTLIKNLEISNLLKIGSIHLLLNLLLSFYYLIKLHPQKFWMIIKSILWNIIYLPQTISKRTKIQKLREKTDSEIFKKIMHGFNITEMFKHFMRVEANF